MGDGDGDDDNDDDGDDGGGDDGDDPVRLQMIETQLKQG